MCTRALGGPTELVAMVGDVAAGCGVVVGGLGDGALLIGKITLPREPAAAGLRRSGIKPPIVMDLECLRV